MAHDVEEALELQERAQRAWAKARVIPADRGPLKDMLEAMAKSCVCSVGVRQEGEVPGTCAHCGQEFKKEE